MKLKKPSDANSGRKPPESPTFFLDRSLGKKTVAQVLRDAGANVEVHDDHFPQDAHDEIWLKEVGVRGWVVLTKDQRIRFRVIEREALKAAGVRAFVLTAGDIDGAAMATIFLKSLRKIIRLCEKEPAPFIATISKKGTLKILPKKGDGK